MIDQLFITGAPFSKYVVAVVVPNMDQQVGRERRRGGEVR
jgi:hypothetical protein